MTGQSTRLNKFIALALGVSRREADDIIRAQRVKVDGAVAEIGGRVDDTNIVTVDDKALRHDTKYRYMAIHKPAGYVCSRRAQGDTPTVYDLLPIEAHDLKLVGRLDKDSSGLIILTNDGDFALRMTHPRFRKTKIYEISLDRDLEPLHQQMIADHGVELQDGTSKLLLERLTDDSRKRWRIIMSEGRNRQIRRTFAALGYEVTSLHRTLFGPYELGALAQGDNKPIKV